MASSISRPEIGDRRAASLPSTMGKVLLGFVLLRFLPKPQGAKTADVGSRPRAGKVSVASPANTQGSGRGREAKTPAQIPKLGWQDIGWRTYEEINKHRLLAVAGGVTFYGLLALFPAIAAIVAIYGLVADLGTVNDHLSALSGVVPAGALEVIGEQVKRIASKGNTTLGFAFLFGLGLSLWSANSGMKAMFDALNVAYGEEEKRGFVGLNLRTIGFTLGAIAFILLALGAIVVIPAILQLAGLGQLFGWLLWIARWPALLGLIIAGLATLYRYGPSRENAQWRWITPGSVLAAIAWLVFSMLFSWYVANFGKYNETYGSLGAAIGFMTWMWLSVTIVLVGAELNAETEHQTAKDTTTGAGKPLGTRGAQMADTVGEAKT
ncbi:MAG: YihY/virulence factor BrkB family protein [Hyphomicrobiales bacterium]|nr:YihY/virulence factor BrkB family protein [Hyphomicrobiales bacterium]